MLYNTGFNVWKKDIKFINQMNGKICSLLQYIYYIIGSLISRNF
jgi:hypothetical protein